MTDNRLPNLSALDDWQLVDDDQDLRGRALLTRTGERIGTVKRMLVDRDAERVAALELDDGRTVAIEEVELRDGQAYLDADAAAFVDRPRAAAGEETIQLVEEELTVGKRSVERGHVRVRSRIVESPVHEQVTLRDEHVEVDRRTVDRPVDGAEADRLFQERSVEMTEVDEEAVVGKTARVVEEVVVRKDVGERVERIDDTVRRTEVEIDDMSAREDDCSRPDR